MKHKEIRRWLLGKSNEEIAERIAKLEADHERLRDLLGMTHEHPLTNVAAGYVATLKAELEEALTLAASFHRALLTGDDKIANKACCATSDALREKILALGGE